MTTTQEAMTHPPTIQVGGVTYVPQQSPSEVRIVVAQRGWVLVGRWQQDGEMVTLTNASVIRRWGTSKGLGELRSGPKPSTTLDPAGTVRLHILTVVLTIDCEAGSWAL